MAITRKTIIICSLLLMGVLLSNNFYFQNNYKPEIIEMVSENDFCSDAFSNDSETEEIDHIYHKIEFLFSPCENNESIKSSSSFRIIKPAYSVWQPPKIN